MFTGVHSSVRINTNDVLQMEIVKIVNDTEEHVAVVHAKGFAETEFAPYRNEYAFFLFFDEEGRKVRRIEEFVDSKFSGGFFEKMQAYLKTQQEGR
jgi:ketosteroid isomerase-like protein